MFAAMGKEKFLSYVMTLFSLMEKDVLLTVCRFSLPGSAWEDRIPRKTPVSRKSATEFWSEKRYAMTET